MALPQHETVIDGYAVTVTYALWVNLRQTVMFNLREWYVVEFNGAPVGAIGRHMQTGSWEVESWEDWDPEGRVLHVGYAACRSDALGMLASEVDL